MTVNTRYSPKIKNPTFNSVTIGSGGDFTLRLAVQADVDANEAQAVGNFIIEHKITKTKREFSAT